MPVAVMVLTALFFAIVLPKEGKRDLVLVLAAFSMLGLVTGYLTGFSRSPAVGAVLPAVLSLVAGMAVFLMGKDAASRTIVALSVLIFSISLVLGTGWGATMRQTAEDYATSETVLKQRALVEAEIREFREALGLPARFEVETNTKSTE
ncbi:hypothetical protein [Azospira restricta]|uniref:Uncharacterized protein n=1 Tax=Azospira restricta TaxID=404405 RepID=A0A974PVL5_9RHOO|nr:hypothetical protein [Azospira restricta]QRJ62265.1 hypothetical protein IWH25_10695 [Azospira restricta]